MFSDLVKATRSFRNFDPDYRLSDETMRSLIELCRYTPSTANSQSIKFAYANTREKCEEIFPMLGWAGYIKENKPPYDGNVPAAYILLCYDTEIAPELEIDAGICAQTIVLGAMDMGIGACMIGSFNKEKAVEIFNLPETVRPRLIIALGRPKESVEIVDAVDGNIKYYRDGKEKHFVPKRTLEEILLK